MYSLFPPNSTKLERSFEQVIERVVDQPIPIRDIRRSSVSPAQYLPWLAWERSVDIWRDDWNLQTKRNVIASSIAVHQKKGTVGALKRVLAAEGWNPSVIEWFNQPGTAAPYTFSVNVSGESRELNAASYQGLIRTINGAKNVRSWLSALNFNIQNGPATLWVGAVFVQHHRISVQPKVTQ
jgi:phage tail P2-like protein